MDSRIWSAVLVQTNGRGLSFQVSIQARMSVLRARTERCAPRRSSLVVSSANQRSTHRSVRALNADVRGWIDTWNDNPRPYVWVKTAEEILDSLASYCKRITDSGH